MTALKNRPATRHAETLEGMVFAEIPSPLGRLSAAATSEGVCRLEFAESAIVGHAGRNDHLRRLEDELVGYFANALQRFTVLLVRQGTPFQQRVWHALQSIPYGEVRSYREVAEQVGTPRAFRAVGRANGTNRIMIVIPCHRVVNHDGQLGGYAYGLERKRYLLNLENPAISL